MRYPKPQNGNPHKLTIDQHGNSYFCGRRLWDQEAEFVFMKTIDDPTARDRARVMSLIGRPA